MFTHSLELEMFYQRAEFFFVLLQSALLGVLKGHLHAFPLSSEVLKTFHVRPH